MNVLKFYGSTTEESIIRYDTRLSFQLDHLLMCNGCRFTHPEKTIKDIVAHTNVSQALSADNHWSDTGMDAIREQYFGRMDGSSHCLCIWDGKIIDNHIRYYIHNDSKTTDKISCRILCFPKYIETNRYPLLLPKHLKWLTFQFIKDPTSYCVWNCYNIYSGNLTVFFFYSIDNSATFYLWNAYMKLKII